MKQLFKNFSAARNEGGKPVPRQLLEALQLRLRKSPVGISEYFEYGIWHRSVTPSMRSEFIGWRDSAALDSKLNNNQSRVLANDKLINHLILDAAGFPTPEPLATYTAGGRRIGSEAVLQTHDEVRAFLKDDVYPFYVKPISAGYGRGVMGVQERDGERFRLFDDSEVSLEQFMAPFAFEPYRGMLFQRPLIAHPAIEELTGTRAISCVRFICFVTPRGPVVHTAFWKITAGKNMLDNFSHGDYGNCLAAVDLDTGKILRAISRMGPGGQIDLHPSTNKQISGFLLPDWQRAVDLVCAASKRFPGLLLQNWDVALCPDGPVLVELNTESELGVPQAISGRGLMDQKLRSILSEIAQQASQHRAAVASTSVAH